MEKQAALENLNQHSTLGKLRRLGTLKPDIRFCYRLPGQYGGAYTRVLPFPRLWPAIVVLAGMTVGFVIPLFQLPMDIGGAEDLFDLTTSLFMLFWAMGWSVGVLALLSGLLLLLFSREVVMVERDSIRLRLELFRFGMESRYPLSRISNLHYLTDSPDKGSKWRRGHLVFDYLQVPVSFGSRLERIKAQQLIIDINQALAHSVPASLPASMQKTLQDVAIIFSNLWVAILALFISHGFSYVENFLRKREYETTDLKTQMHKPYARIIAMHITLIVGGFLILALDAPILALSLLLILKMAADGTAHLKEHKKA